LLELLEINEEEFEEHAHHKPARMVTAIRTMRHL
jgi:hypothetical protein